MLNIINFILLGGEFIWILFKKDFCCFVSARQAFITVWSFWGFRIVLETLSRANFTLLCGTIFLESNKILVQVWPRCSGLQACLCMHSSPLMADFQTVPMDPSLLQSTPKFQLPLPLQLEPASSTLTTAYSQQMLRPAWPYSSHGPLFSGHAIFLSYAPLPSSSLVAVPGPLLPHSQKKPSKRSSQLVQAGASLPAPWFSFQWLSHRNSNRPKHSPIPTECWEDLWVYPATREMETWELNRLAGIAN